jgi:hypothetical protein
MTARGNEPYVNAALTILRTSGRRTPDLREAIGIADGKCLLAAGAAASGATATALLPSAGAASGAAVSGAAVSGAATTTSLPPAGAVASGAAVSGAAVGGAATTVLLPPAGAAASGAASTALLPFGGPVGRALDGFAAAVGVSMTVGLSRPHMAT